jgi:Asp/Glu/hydantoin racemase
MTTLALLHTGAVVIQPLKELARTHLPGVRLVNLLDDSIVSEIERVGSISDAVRSRVAHLGHCAVEGGADALLITCSSISQLAEPVQDACGLPVFKIDEAMADEAVRLGSRIGVVATLPTTLGPTCALIESRAQLAGAAVTLRRALRRDAFDLLTSGDEEGHDRLLVEAVTELAGESDVIVLAQASMARIRSRLDVAVPVLSSPELGVKRVREQLGALGLLAKA